MAITKTEIDNTAFNTVNRSGYDPEEVDLFLERLAEEVDTFNRALIEAAARVEAAEARAKAAEQQAAQSAQSAQAAQTLGSAQQAASERQIAQALIAAQKSADEVRESARAESEKAYREADQRARDIVRDALSEKQRIIDEIERLRVSTERFRSEYLALLGRYTSEAQKSLPTLDDASPDITAEKKATAEAVAVLREGDVSFAAPAPEPEPAPAPALEPASEPVAEAPAVAAADPFEPAAATTAAAKPNFEPISLNRGQTSFEIDDELDIEEID